MFGAIVDKESVCVKTRNLGSVQGTTVYEDFVDGPTEEVVCLAAGCADPDTVRADRRRRADDGNLLDAVEVGLHGCPIEGRREMVPCACRDAPAKVFLDDRVSGSVLCFEGERGAAEPECRVVFSAQPDWMLVSLWPVLPLGPKGDRPLGEPGHGDKSGDFVVRSIEFPRLTELPQRLCGPSHGPVMRIPGRVLYPAIEGEIVHIV